MFFESMPYSLHHQPRDRDKCQQHGNKDVPSKEKKNKPAISPHPKIVLRRVQMHVQKTPASQDNPQTDSGNESRYESSGNHAAASIAFTSNNPTNSSKLQMWSGFKTAHYRRRPRLDIVDEGIFLLSTRYQVPGATR